MLKITALGTFWVMSLGLAALPAAASEALPATLASALEGAGLDTADGWSFRKTVRIEAMGEPAVVTVTRWDMSKPAGKQCSVVSVRVEGVADSKASDEDPCEEGHARGTYGELVSMLHDAAIEPVSEDDAVALYRITPRDREQGFRLGGLELAVDPADLESMTGTVRVAKTGWGAPYVESADIHLQQPAGNMIAKLNRLDVTLRYAPDRATGIKQMTGMSFDMDLRMFTLFNVTTKVVTSFDEFERLQ